MTADVRQVDRRGSPVEVVFTFDVPLEDVTIVSIKRQPIATDGQ